MTNKVPPVMNHRQAVDELRVSSAASFRGTSVRKSHELIEFDERLTDAEIASTIRYLDPDLRTESEGKDTGAIAVCIALLIGLTIAILSIYLHVRTL